MTAVTAHAWHLVRPTKDRYQCRVASDEFSNAALILVGHGSTVNAASAAPVYQHAELLRQQNIFVQVRECFWKIEPSIRGVLAQVHTPRVFVVPLFISEGYFTQDVIPRELGLRTAEQSAFSLVQQRGAQTLYYCAPVGTHPSMTTVLLARAQSTLERHPFPHAPKLAETTLFIAGHGTEKNENSRQAVEDQVRLVRARGLYAACHAVFIEEDPRIGDCFQLAQTKNIVVVPFFISDGMHTQEDIPVLLGEPARLVQQRLQQNQPTWRNPTERHGKRIWYSAAVGTEPSLSQVILERAREKSHVG